MQHLNLFAAHLLCASSLSTHRICTAPGYLAAPWGGLRVDVGFVGFASDWVALPWHGVLLFRRVSNLSASVGYLFEGHPLVVQHLVPSLLNLYTGVSLTEFG